MSLLSRIANVFRGERVNRDIEDELASHIEEAISRGRDPVEARQGPWKHASTARERATKSA